MHDGTKAFYRMPNLPQGRGQKGYGRSSRRTVIRDPVSRRRRTHGLVVSREVRLGDSRFGQV